MIAYIREALLSSGLENQTSFVCGHVAHFLLLPDFTLFLLKESYDTKIAKVQAEKKGTVGLLVPLTVVGRPADGGRTVVGGARGVSGAGKKKM